MNRTQHFSSNYWLLITALLFCALPALLATNNCNNLSFSADEESIQISGLTLSSKVELIGANTDWQVTTICDGNCQTTTIIPDLAKGVYSVKVNLNALQGYCYREEKIEVKEKIDNPNSTCQFEISPSETNARILCFEVDDNGFTTLNVAEGQTIVQKQLDKDGKVISSTTLGDLVTDSVLIRDNRIIKKLANGSIEYSRSIPTTTLEIIPNIEAVTELSDGSFVLAGFQKFFNPDFELETNDSLLIVITDKDLVVQNTILETQNGGPNVIRFDRVNRIIPRPNNQFILYYSKGVQGPVLIDVFKNFVKYQKVGDQPEQLQDFRTVGILNNQVNVSPCNDFLITDTQTRIVTIKGSSSSRGFLSLDLNDLAVKEGRSVGSRSVDFFGTQPFYSYSYDISAADEFPTLSIGYSSDLNNQVDTTKMAIRFFENTDVPSHTKIIPSIAFDRVIRTGDTTCLILFKQEGRLLAVNPDCSTTPATTASCDNLIFKGTANQITVEGLTTNSSKVEIIGRNTDWQVIPICEGDCPTTLLIPDLEVGEYAVKVNQSGSDDSYCYREEKVLVESSNSDTIVDCDNLVFSTLDGQISVEGLTASYDKVEIIGRNTDWQVVLICEGDCGDSQAITDLAAGEYSVKVNQGGSDGSFCYREETVLLENGSDSRNLVFDSLDELMLYPNPGGVTEYV
ncbi:MAG: hypothetical protein AAGJ18_01940 [Bacteroidota bacterium]